MDRIRARTCVALMLLACGSGAGRPVRAAEEGAHAPAPCADRLTGDWGGLRSDLADRGVAFELDSTHYYQGLLAGTGDGSFEYGGRIDAYFSFDTGKLGLWEGGTFGTHVEYRYGDLPANLGLALLATNTGMVLPQGADDEWVATAIYYSQQFGDDVNLRVGKINALDLLAGHPFFGGGGVSRFMHLAFAGPPSGITPPSIVGGLLSIQTEPFTWTVMAYDPNDRTDDYDLSGLFEDGVNVSVSGGWRGKVSGRTTSVTLSGTVSTKDGVDFGDVLLPENLQTSEKDGSYHASLELGHFLYEPPGRPGRGWGIFLKLGLSDGNPNPFQASLTGGIGGRGLFESRPDDAFGAGYFYHGLSDELQSVLEPLLDIRDEQGVEVFYSFAVTRWLDPTVDLQYLRPALGEREDAWVGGLRARFKL